MEIMESSSSGDPDVKTTHTAEGIQDVNSGKAGNDDAEKDENIFANENIVKDSVVKSEKSDITITPEDKTAFIDAIVSNTRFTKEYSLFGGRLKFTVRSLTSDEVNAIATWTAKIGTKDTAGLVAGKYRKYLLAAQVSMLNGVEMPPLEEPLYEHVGSDGKTVEPPGWIKRCDYWDNVGFGQFQAILGCCGEFDALYSILCSKAEDSNFWNPDTP